MRPCSVCGTAIDDSSLFCSACGTKVPEESRPTESHASVHIQSNVDPLASTSPASPSPARDLAPVNAGAAAVSVSPKAETGFVTPANSGAAIPPERASTPKASTRGKTMPLSAMPNPPKIVSAPPAPSPAPQRQPPPQAPFAVQAQVSPVPPVGAPPPVAAMPCAPGARVLVQWSNGQRYPGVVEQISGPQCLVHFDAGEKRWVETRFVLPASP